MLRFDKKVYIVNGIYFGLGIFIWILLELLWKFIVPLRRSDIRVIATLVPLVPVFFTLLYYYVKTRTREIMYIMGAIAIVLAYVVIFPFDRFTVVNLLNVLWLVNIAYIAPFTG